MSTTAASHSRAARSAAPSAPLRTSTPTPLRPQAGAPVDAGGAAFAWTPLPDVERYRVQIARDDAFQNLLLDADLRDAAELTVYDLLPEDGRTRFWRVCAEGGAWSEAVPFVASGIEAVIAHDEARRAAAAQERKESERRQAAEEAAGLPPYRVGTTTDANALVVIAFALLALLSVLLITSLGGAI